MARTKAVKPPAKPGTGPLQGLLTDEQLAAFGLDVETASDVLHDATVIYVYVQHNPYATRADILKATRWDMESEGGPARLDRAVNALVKMGKVAELG
jgi:hypothetical protein